MSNDTGRNIKQPTNNARQNKNVQIVFALQPKITDNGLLNPLHTNDNITFKKAPQKNINTII
eukprot:UN24338